MADANYHESDSLRVLGLTFSTDMKGKGYTELIATSSARNVDSM